MSEGRVRVDWEALRPHYEAGVRALKDIGREFGCSDAAIVKHARAAGWTRCLKAKIQAKADAKVAAALVAQERAESPEARLTEAVRVEIESEVQARILIGQRDTLKRLAASVATLVALVDREPHLKARVLATKALAETVAKLIPLERQAYGIDKELPPDPVDQVDPVDGARRLAFILSRANAALTVH